MKCANCGAEIKVGNIYCSNCGKEIQLVPEYNISEDDIFQEVKEQKEQQIKAEEEEKAQEIKKENIKKRKKNMLIMIIAILLVLIVVVALVISAVNKRSHSNSYEYQLKKAQEEFANGDYEEAISYAERALSLDDESVEAYLLEGKCYASLLEYKLAIRNFKEVLTLDDTNKDAVEQLINVYSTDEDTYYADMLELAEEIATKDDSLLKLFEGHLISQPIFSVAGGSFNEPVTLEISAEDNTYSIYYTLDGSEPASDSELYTEPIELSNGENVVSAVCIDSGGHMSLQKQETYSLTLTPPETPSISLPSGTYRSQMSITISVPDGATAYYTWDGSEPTENSAVYRSPLQLIEGNNILSVIIYDKNGLASDIATRSYLYLPEDDDSGEDDSVEVDDVETLE